ncbi:penicillin acylase family protein [Nocardioides sp. InS609-2]|uniref:penicillin acylase family protein n=1 Tax=Nocardioides sp. InS609-2 TaxID=2760705 RepID=UPI0020C0C716|nr:penicillin acylase family protein [Nocardioides sp. InS609-2]
MSEHAASPPPNPATPLSWWRIFRGWPRPARWSVYVATGLVLVLIAALVVGWVFYCKPLPQTDGEIDVPGLSARVEVIRDDMGIPQIYADSDDDLMRAQGFVHAQERFFEMDVRRHITAGRLSEMFGETGLETDKFIRTMGWRAVAEREVALLEPETREALEQYAEGVNAFLAQHEPSDIAVEYTLLRVGGLDYTPEPWTSVDSLAWLKAMAWDLRGNMQEEMDRVIAGLDHDAAEVDQLYPAYDDRAHRPIVTQGAVVDGVYEQDATRNATRKPQRPAYPAAAVDELERLSDRIAKLPALIGKGDGIGSNSWVVDGEHSATGMPLLANDPHLGISQPGIWMQMGMHCRTIDDDCSLDVSGFTFSGVPGVIIGHNADIAWGFTNLGPDVSDLYLEQVRGTEWKYDGDWLPLEERTETIKVHGGDDFTFHVRSTDHGPLLSDVSSEISSVGANAPPDPDDPEATADRGNGYAVALQWTALQPSPTADAILGLNRASDWPSFREAASKFDVPAQNMVYADREGHIGYQAPGRVPIRKSGNDGRQPAAGWQPENDWTGDFVPFTALPSVLDPDEGFVATANQAVVGPDYPYYLTTDWDRGYRSQRIRDLIESEGDLSVAEMAQIQLDEQNPLAPTLVPYLLDVELPRGYYRRGQNLLRGWDFQDRVDSGAAAYFNVVWSNLLRLTFQDELRERVWPSGGDRWFGVMEGLLTAPAGPWWDDRTTDDEVETRDDILRAAMIAGRDEMTARQARNPDDWSWGHLHRLNLHNATLGESDIGPIEWLVNRDGAQIGGGASVVNATSWDATDGYAVTSSPSMRMVVSLADFDDSRWVNLTGVSGHPASDHYDDQTDLFVEGETLPWSFTREAVDEAADDTLVLNPASADD